MGPRLLIVDDDPSIRESLAEWFSESGYLVNVVGSAASALQWFGEVREPCVVLSDVRMKGMDGLELARTISHRFPDRGARIILVTGWGGIDRAEYRDIPSVVGLVRKPFDVEALSKLVSVQLELTRQ